ncbi:MAG: hypothetical protein M1818_005339 [Claussenomyces sp. TS43310]|nr:MAG: hypothetical protein M1818_005339 [Claussenomyces sp. TS43310]
MASDAANNSEDCGYLQRYLEDSEGPRMLGQQTTSLNRISEASGYQSGSHVAARAVAWAPLTSYDTISTRSSSSPSQSSAVFSSNKTTSSRSSASSAAHSIAWNPGQTLDEQTLARMSIQEPYLPCLLAEISGCNIDFDINNFEDWQAHNLSHFEEHGPPKSTMCIFCDSVFEDNSRRQSWKKCMSHIAEHFEEGAIIERSRPDFGVIKRLYEKKLLSREDYEHALGGSERPLCRDADFRHLSWEPQEMREKMEAEARKNEKVVIMEPRRHGRSNQRSKPSKSKSSATSRQIKVSRE